jgi:hypothetical protein
VAANQARGGVVSAFLGPLETQFVSSIVGAAITSAEVVDGKMFVQFKGGTLETADRISGPWNDTGNDSGEYSEMIDADGSRFFRVRAVIR